MCIYLEAVIERAKKALAPAMTSGRHNFGLADAKGATLRDTKGNAYIDFFGGVAVCATGHSHPKVVEAIKLQAEKFIHGFLGGTYFYIEPAIEFAERLKEIAPGDLRNGKVFFCNSGSEAVEGGIKLARLHTKRPEILGFLSSFHGRTLGAASITSSKSSYRKTLIPLMSGVVHVPYPYCYRCIFKQEYPDCDMYCLDYINLTLKTLVYPDDLATILVEPIIGEGGYIVPPDEFLPRLRKLCDENEFLLTCDEVQTGFGRTGKMFACELNNVEPDIMLTAKGIASGMPIGAIIAKSEIMETFQPGVHATTFGGNPVSCVAGIATIDVIQQEHLVDKAASLGAHTMKRLKEMLNERSFIGDVRGKGLMIGVELVKDKKNKEPLSREAIQRLYSETTKRGLAIAVTGTYSNVIRIAPPLVITGEQVDRGLEIIEDSLKQLER